jgi:cobalt-zinc-cadmium efflux system membrane fusion protein
MRPQSALALILLLAVGCGGSTEKPTETPANKDATPAKEEHSDAAEVRVDSSMLRDLRITTAAVESRRGGDTVSLLGELAVDERAYAEVGVPIGARVTRLLAAPGDAVREGQPLLHLDSPELGRLRADYLTAEARVTLAESALKRKKELAAERIAPLREVQEAEATLAETRAAMRSAVAALSALGVATPTTADGDKPPSSGFTLQAPVTGTVIERSAVMGQMLDPSKPAFRIANLSSLWLTVHAFERDAVRISRGAAARLSFPALPGEVFSGLVTLVGGEVAKDSRTVPIRIDVQNRGGRLRPGMSATAAVPVGSAAGMVLAVPVASVQRVRNEWCVFLPKANGVFEIRKIGRGRDLGGEVEVLSGLKAGETIVVDGAFLLKSHAEKGEAGHGGHGGQP